MTEPAKLVTPKPIQIDRPVVAVVQLATQHPGVIHQVILHPGKVKDNMIRLGEFPADEVHGWVFLSNLAIVSILGDAVYDEEKKIWKCVVNEGFKPVIEWPKGEIHGNE
jgi:hypothetical protein